MIFENKEKLRETYPDEWVAIFERRLIDHSEDFHKLIVQVEDMDIDTGKVELRSITPKDILETRW